MKDAQMQRLVDGVADDVVAGRVPLADFRSEVIHRWAEAQDSEAIYGYPSTKPEPVGILNWREPA